MRLTWLADVLRGAGLTVVEHGDWRSRGRDLNSAEGIVWHHTATGPNWTDDRVVRLLIDGRPDLPGPLSQLGLSRSGVYHVVAAGRCNHNGHGLWGNQSLGIEAFNDGVGERWSPAQLDAWERGTAAICRHAGWAPSSKVKGHKETDPLRKVDPRGIDMSVARARITTALNQPSEVAPMFNPPLALRPIVAELACPTGGAWLLGDDGSVYAFGGAPYNGGCNGKPYFVGRKPARLVAATSADGAPGYVVIATSGERYGPAF